MAAVPTASSIIELQENIAILTHTHIYYYGEHQNWLYYTCWGAEKSLFSGLNFRQLIKNNIKIKKILINTFITCLKRILTQTPLTRPWPSPPPLHACGKGSAVAHNYDYTTTLTAVESSDTCLKKYWNKRKSDHHHKQCSQIRENKPRQYDSWLLKRRLQWAQTEKILPHSTCQLPVND